MKIFKTSKYIYHTALLSDLTVDEFFSSGRGGEESQFSRLGRMLAEILQTLPENVQIFSVSDGSQQDEKAVSVWFAAHGSPYYRPEKLHGYVSANKAKVSKDCLNDINVDLLLARFLRPN